mmetsp:Transcript_17400/g.34124  ORF Transcript_17400/g.34124 Transcript_17400/m.34124 type:complete len:209 (-) Transcript_17400:1136-1762(-)
MTVLGRQIRRPVHEVPEGVSELSIVHRHHRLLTEGHVSAEGRSIHEVSSEGVAAVLVELLVGVDDVAERLRHLLALLIVDKAMRVDSLGQRHTARHMHARPDDRVEPNNVLADQVHVAGPVLHPLAVGKVGGREVVCEGIEPDVHDMLLLTLQQRVLRHRHAPVKRRAGYRQVTKRLLEAGEDLVAAVVWHNKLLVVLNVGYKPLLIL